MKTGIRPRLAASLLLATAPAFAHECESGQLQDCPVANGWGRISCVFSRTPVDPMWIWGPCEPAGCNPGYVLDGGACVQATTIAARKIDSDQKGTAGNTSTASQVASQQEGNLSDSAKQLAEKSDGGQESSRLDARKANELGANHGATVGAIFCAEGANATLEKNPGLGAQSLASCESYFQSARALNRLYGRDGFVVDASVAGAPGTRATLERFEGNFGVNPEEFLRRMLGSRSHRDELAELSSAKLAPARLEKAWELAAERSPESGAESFLVAFGAKASAAADSGKGSDKLRKKLKSVLENGVQTEEGAAKAGAGPDRPALAHLTALSAQELLPGSDTDEAELSLFDVVHRKYRELRRRKAI